MRKIDFKGLVGCLALTLCFVLASCGAEPEVFDESLIVGKWVSGTEYYRYDRNGNGATWDTSDDVSEDEAQAFTWEFNSSTNKLTLYHQMEMGGVIPKQYTMTKLTDAEMKYKDNYDREYTYNRVN